jgi:hypothetical protein
MMEQYSYEPAPGPREASLDISNYLRSNYGLIPKYSERIREANDKDITDVAFTYYSRHIPEWSMAAWYSGGLKEYAEATIMAFVRKQKSIRKIRGIIKTCALMYLWYKDTIERRYMPGGVFEKEAATIWNPILNPNKPALVPHPPRDSPPPPPNSPRSMPSQGGGIRGLRMIKFLNHHSS